MTSIKAPELKTYSILNNKNVGHITLNKRIIKVFANITYFYTNLWTVIQKLCSIYWLYHDQYKLLNQMNYTILHMPQY
jgi:hypothetical protein